MSNTEPKPELKPESKLKPEPKQSKSIFQTCQAQAEIHERDGTITETLCGGDIYGQCDLCQKWYCVNCMYNYCRNCGEYLDCFWCGWSRKHEYFEKEGIGLSDPKRCEASFYCKKCQY